MRKVVNHFGGRLVKAKCLTIVEPKLLYVPSGRDSFLMGWVSQ